MPLAERRVAVRAIFDASGDGERFRPFARAEREALQAAYAARPRERIAELDPDMLIRV